MAYNYEEEKVNALIEWAENAVLPQEVILSEAEHITDPKIFVRANINDIKAHYPDAFYNASIDRLYRLKEFLEGTAE